MSTATPNASSDVLDFVVHKANGLKGLVDTGLQSLPRQYIQPPERRLHASQVISQESIPIIDVSNWDDPQLVESIFEAASKWGFFQIINHGIPQEILDHLQDAAHGFFGLPNEERKKFWKGKSPTDTAFLATSFTPLKEKVLEWKDYLSFRYIPGDEKSQTLWPSVCKDPVLDYMKRVEMVIKKLLELLLTKLNVREIDKEKEYALMGSLTINLNYYPHCPNPELVTGVGCHSDISSITVLLQDDIGGLYVRGIEEDSWIHIPPVNGALVINIGDVLQIMSNDQYKSIEHRVVANGSKNRVSVPIFVNPGPDALIGPLPEVLETGAAPRYKPILFSDYFSYFFSKGHDGKNSINYAKI
ncbi:hypothetical protein P3X46_015557 [Hevea brasiliensis]|uniref:Fe2OG dioxygenase domain-containing protein n=1 Tax=Hevea brasiliensis TaxID=3981 RepID=A0ABQ9LXP4_HEVBR|nr:feruloyl CoA ortho-hydroxylase F6H1-3 [Hevea brasiliensis]KAJ9172308.1 hypothetical protein P3X46_015557 [Hevea brasiliensis]